MPEQKPHVETEVSPGNDEADGVVRVIGSWFQRPRRDARHFTLPAVRPPTMYFCRKRNRIITGIAAITAPAANADQSA